MNPQSAASLEPSLLGKLVGAYGLSDSALRSVLARHEELHRGYHNLSHIERLFARIQSDFVSGRFEESVFLQLLAAALFHDAIYDSRAKDNEERSAALFEGLAGVSREIVSPIATAIRETSYAAPPETMLGRAFAPYDLADSLTWPIWNSHDLHNAVYREYGFHALPAFREGRRKALEHIARLCAAMGLEEISASFGALANSAGDFAPTALVYAGSFNPFHIGHLDVLRRAEKFADKVIIAVGVNRAKDPDTLPARVQSVQEQLWFHEVRCFETLLTDLAAELRAEGYSRVGIVRGLRGSTDYRAERNLVRNLEDLDPGVGVVFVHCSRGLEHVSSSSIKEIRSFRAEAAAPKVPSAAQVYALQE